MPHLWGVVA